MGEIQKDFDKVALKKLKPVDKILKQKAKTLEKDLTKHFKRNSKEVNMRWYKTDGLVRITYLPDHFKIKTLEGYRVLHEKCKELDISVSDHICGAYGYPTLIFNVNEPYSASPDASLFNPVSKKQDVQTDTDDKQKEDNFSAKTKRAIPVKKHLDLK